MQDQGNKMFLRNLFGLIFHCIVLAVSAFGVGTFFVPARTLSDPDIKISNEWLMFSSIVFSCEAFHIIQATNRYVNGMLMNLFIP